MSKGLEKLLREIFRPAHIDIKEDEEKTLVVTLTGLKGFEWDDFDSIEESDEYLVEAWMFDCEDGGKLILYIQEVESNA